MQFRALLSLALASVASAHFLMSVPTSLGFDEDKASQAPCGSFNIANRTTVTNWPANGGPVDILSVDNMVNATVGFGMPNGTSTMFMKSISFMMTGQGDLCLPQVPIPAAMRSMVGTDMVMQVMGKTDDGVAYQCAAIKVTAPSQQAAQLPANCKNSTGVKATRL